MKLLNSSEDIKFNSSTQDELVENQEVTFSSVNSETNSAFDLIGLTKLRNDPQFAGIDGSGFSIAVIDTGIDKEHSLLASNYIAGYDFVDDNNDPKDNHGHGTHVIGTVGAADPNIGVATDVGLIALRALNDQGTGSLSDIEDSLEWVLANQKKYNITAVNLSFGIGHFTPESGFGGDILSDDIKRLEKAGVTVISATGNNYFNTAGQENIAYPAVDSTIAVGAVWQDSSISNFQLPTGSKDFTTGADRITSFSQRLDVPNVVFAPGAIINSTVPGGGLDGRAGTSQAAPHVAGAVALMQEASMQFNKRLLTPDEVLYILSTTGDTITDGDDEDDNVANTNTTYSRINIYNAIAQVKSIGTTVIPDLNGTIAGAYSINFIDGENTKIVTGNIGRDETHFRNNDVDLYGFELEASGIVGLEISSDSTNKDDFNSYLRLFDNVGNQIAFNDNVDRNNTFSRLDINLEPGQYYVGVSGSDNSKYQPNKAGSGVAAETGNYSLEFSLSYQDSDGLISSARPVSLNNLEPLTFDGNIGLDNNHSVGTGDVDLFRIVAPANGVLLLDIDTPYENNFVDSWLRIFDQSGNELTFAENQQAANNNNSLAFDLDGQPTEFADPNNVNIILEQNTSTNLRSGVSNANSEYEKGNYGHPTDSFIAVQVNEGDVYFVGISDVANRNYNLNSLDNRPDTGKGGRYELTTTFINNDIKQDTEAVKEETSAPISDINADEKENADPVKAEASVPINDSDADIKEDIDPVKAEASAPINDSDADIKESVDPVNEVALEPINDEDLVSGATVHRFFRADIGVHFYTANETEKDIIENTLPHFNYEGASFIAAESSTDSLTGTKPVHRFLNITTGTHLYTIDETEREFVGSNLDNYDYEGVAYHAYESDLPGTTPLYRFYNSDLDAHFYTPNSGEKDFLEANLPAYQLEGDSGIAFYVEPI